MKSFDNKKFDDSWDDSWYDDNLTNDNYDGDDSYDGGDDDDFEIDEPKNYNYEKTKSILKSLNMKHLENFMREMKLKKINKKNNL